MKPFHILLLNVLWVSLASCAQPETFDQMLDQLLSNTVQQVRPEQVKKMNYPFILDARERAEYEVSHIPGAIHIGYEKFDIRTIPKVANNRPIVVYCSVGYRSEKIAEKLIEAGYPNVVNLRGGIFQWVNEGNAVENKSGVTKKVHTYNEKWAKWLLIGEKQW